MKSAIVTFFDCYPPKTGSGNVCFDFFSAWPVRKKKLFQFSEKNTKKYGIKNIKIKKNTPIFKLIRLPSLIYFLIKYFSKTKKNILILEGPSWIFYSFITIFITRKIIKNLFIIYRSHSVELEIRKENSNFIIYLITKKMEDYVLKNANIFTSVSKIEYKKFINYYNKKTYIFPNSLDINRVKKIKERKIKLPNKFIIFSGSYDYKPNKFAIDYISESLLPFLKKKNIHLVITGHHKKIFKNKYIKNLGFVSFNELKYINRRAICLIVPIFEGYGTRIKILESLIWSNRIVSSKKGIEGIDYSKNKNIIVTDQRKKMLKSILLFSNLKKKNYYNSKYFQNISMRANTDELYKLTITKLNEF